MAQRIENPAEWYGHETEELLAIDDGAGKELVVVAAIKNEAEPVAFYRVKERGQEPVEFTNWLEAVDYYNCIGDK